MRLTYFRRSATPALSCGTTNPSRTSTSAACQERSATSWNTRSVRYGLS